MSFGIHPLMKDNSVDPWLMTVVEVGVDTSFSFMLDYWAIPAMNEMFIDEPRITEFNPNPDANGFLKILGGVTLLSLGGKYI